MQRRHFIRIAGGGTIAAATMTSAGLTGCSPGMPPEAIEAWQGPGRDAAPDDDVRRWLLSYAILAPHSHNLQSWVVDLSTPDEILLRCDLKRLLPQTDPLSRQIMMSHGTFLALLDLVARWRASACRPTHRCKKTRCLRIFCGATPTAAPMTSHGRCRPGLGARCLRR